MRWHGREDRQASWSPCASGYTTSLCISRACLCSVTTLWQSTAIKIGRPVGCSTSGSHGLSIVVIGLLNTIYSWIRAPENFQATRSKCTSDWVNLSIPRIMDRNYGMCTCLIHCRASYSSRYYLTFYLLSTVQSSSHCSSVLAHWTLVFLGLVFSSASDHDDSRLLWSSWSQITECHKRTPLSPY